MQSPNGLETRWVFLSPKRNERYLGSFQLPFFRLRAGVPNKAQGTRSIELQYGILQNLKKLQENSGPRNLEISHPQLGTQNMNTPLKTNMSPKKGLL